MHDEARGEKESQSEREMERQWLICETMLEIGSWHTTIYTVHVYILIKNNSDAAHSLNRCMESTRLHAYKQQKHVWKLGMSKSRKHEATKTQITN